MTLGTKIKDLRAQSGLLQRELAASLEVGEGYLSKVENDVKPLKREHLKTLSDLFNVPLSELETLWLATKVYFLVKDEDQGLSALKVAEEKVKYSTDNE